MKLRTARDVWWTGAATMLLVVATVALTITDVVGRIAYRHRSARGTEREATVVALVP